MTPKGLVIARVVAVLLGGTFGIIIEYFLETNGTAANGALPFSLWLAAIDLRNAVPPVYFGAMSGYAIFECVRIIRR